MKTVRLTELHIPDGMQKAHASRLVSVKEYLSKVNLEIFVHGNRETLLKTRTSLVNQLSELKRANS
jgi:hypothetical protein